MIPAEWQLRPPDGVSDEITRLLLQLTEERLGAVPVERALVWAVEHQPQDVLAHIAAALGLTRLTWLSDDPAELLAGGREFAGRLGTPRAVEDALAALGYTAWCHEDTALYCDGSIRADGTFAAGADRHWARWWLVVAAADLEEQEVARLVTIVEVAGRRSAHLRQVYLVDTPGAFGHLGAYRVPGFEVRAR